MDCLINLFISDVSRDVSYDVSCDVSCDVSYDVSCDFSCDVSCEASCDVVYVSYDVSLEDSGDDSHGILNVNGAHSIARPTDAWSVNKCALRYDPVYASTTRVSAVLVCAGRTACVVH